MLPPPADIPAASGPLEMVHLTHQNLLFFYLENSHLSGTFLIQADWALAVWTILEKYEMTNFWGCPLYFIFKDFILNIWAFTWFFSNQSNLFSTLIQKTK